MTVDYLTFNTKMNWLNEGARVIEQAVFFGSRGRSVNRGVFRFLQEFLKNELDKRR